MLSFITILLTIQGTSVLASSKVIKVNKKSVSFKRTKSTRIHQKVAIYRGKEPIAFGEVIKLRGKVAFAVIAFTKKNYKVRTNDLVVRTTKTIRNLRVDISQSLPSGRFSATIGGPFQFSFGASAERFLLKKHAYGLSGSLITQEVDKVSNTGASLSAQYSYCKSTCFDNSLYVGGNLGALFLNSSFTNIDGVSDFELKQNVMFLRGVVGYQFKMDNFFYSVNVGVSKIYSEETVLYENKNIPNPLSDQFITGQFTFSYVY